MQSAYTFLFIVLGVLTLPLSAIEIKKPSISVLLRHDLKRVEEFEITANYEEEITENILGGADFRLGDRIIGPSRLYLEYSKDALTSGVSYSALDRDFSWNGKIKKGQSSLEVFFRSLFKKPVLKGSTQLEYFGYKTSVSPIIDITANKVTTTIEQDFPSPKASARLVFCQAFKAAKLELIVKPDKKTRFSPILDLKTKEVSYAYEKKTSKYGKLNAKLVPTKHLNLKWEKEVKNGAWVAVADVGLEKKAKLLWHQKSI